MSSPRGETQRRNPGEAVDGGRIPPQTTAALAPENGLLPGLNGARRSAHPAGSVQSPAPPGSRAGVVTRLLAAAVDAVAVVVLAALLDLAAAGARFLWSPADFQWPQVTAALVLTMLPAVAVVYLTVGWALAGRTYGAKLMGLRVLSARLELPGWARSFLRAVVCVVWPVGLLWCAIDRARRSVADLAARTVVVYDTRPYARVRDGA